MSDHTTNIFSQVSSPAATGGAGVFFEQHVDASFLSLLLVRGIPPVLTDCYVAEVHVQAEHLGWHTDDLLVVGRAGPDAERRLLCQVKRTFRISATDEDCRKAFEDFWTDFCNRTLFRRGEDQFAVITSRGTNRLLADLCGLLDTARAAWDAADFAHRVSIQGVVSDAARRYCGQIRTLLDEANATPVSDDDFFLFLRHVHLISYDLNTSTSQTEAWIKTLLAHTASGHDKTAVATHTWTALLKLVASGMPHAASYTREALPSAILASHTPVGSSDHDALRALHQHGVPVFQNIRTTIGVDCHLPRDEVETRLLTTLAQHRIVVVAGPAGSGKSAVAKSAVQRLADGCLTFAFRAEEFAHPHLDRALLDSQIPLNTVQLTAILAGQGRKLLLIESVERLLEASVRDAFSDLLNLIQGDSSWSVVLTCRDYSLEVVRSSFLQSTGLPHAIVDVPPLSEAEIESVIASVPALARPASNPGLRFLFQNPYILDKASRMTWPATATLPQDERTFRQKFWREVVRDESVSTNALPRRRGQVFIDLALRRARTLERYAPCGDFDPQALQGLHQNDLIEFSRHTDTLASPAHDVLEDWAILEWLEQTAQQSGGTPASLANAVDAYPALRRAYRKWLGEFLECHAQEAGQFVFAVLQDQSLPAHFRDDTVVSTLLASTAPRFVQQHEQLLLADGAQLLR